ncbi:MULTISPECIES: ABC transporter substrate-binding protein [unclassified Aureimonas]|uniref:ABC transporter substrate-binding protein n=1 Tax=unclassified Aureimonas TaxID=2615206 RepID=UPI000700D8C9|nr:MULTISPECIES: ABC transporter substrate-binding protein [unclassified Aureimonas]KQT64199.1 peptide ABC transporter substrate-binding protein [Aureimonas sp. Leaf427]KQT81388.1 peptide ABC transporter substrate-binding protein [Aureimonas sp. Leaf460]
MMRVSTFLAATALALTLGSAASAKTLVYCSEGSPEGFDPGLYTAGTTFDASSKTTYNRLTEFKKGTTEVVPGLAESWTVSDDGLVYTFKLRPGVKFQTTDFFTPTRDFNADDVIFTFDRQSNKENPFAAYAGDNTYGYYSDMDMPKLVKSFEKVDDLTVKLTLNQPNAPMLATLAMDFASVMSKEYADKLIADGTPEKLNQVPLGTGPFSFVAYQQDAVIRYKAHPDYWGGKQSIDDLVFAITPDASVRIQRLKAGECQMAAYPNPADVPALKEDATLNVMEQPGLNIGYIAWNSTQAPFDKPEVRRAMNMAINKQAIIDAVYPGIGQIAKNPIPPTLWGYNDAVEDDKYDPDAAKAALEAAGVKDLSMKLWAMPVARPYNPNGRRMAELIQADLAKVGVTAEVVSYDWTQYLKLAGDPKHDGAVMAGWTGDNGDPDNFVTPLLGCNGVGSGNKAAWCNKEFDDLIKKASATPDQGERAKLYEQAQLVFKKDAPWATIAHSLVVLPMSKKISGYEMDPLGSHRFDGVDISE